MLFSVTGSTNSGCTFPPSRSNDPRRIRQCLGDELWLHHRFCIMVQGRVFRIADHNRPATRRRPCRHIAWRIADHPALLQVQFKIFRRLQDHPRLGLAAVMVQPVFRNHRLRVIRAVIGSINMRAACSRSCRHIS